MEDKEIVQQIEPVRRTFLNVLKDNFRAADRSNYVHRLIYIGEHSFHHDTGTSIADFMNESVQKVNDEYNDEQLSGVLVYYPKYFCQIIEGSEDSIIKHLLLITGHETFSPHLVRMKILVCYHHINQRFLPEWVAVTGKPPTLLERIDVMNTDIVRTSRYIFNCVQKLYKLAAHQKPKISITSSGPSDDAASVLTSASMDSRMTMDRTKTITTVLTERYPDCLPEYGLIDFLLTTPYTQDLTTYINTYGVVQTLDAYKDKVWPVPTEFVPYHIFDKPIDPVTDLPISNPLEVDAFKEVE